MVNPFRRKATLGPGMGVVEPVVQPDHADPARYSGYDNVAPAYTRFSGYIQPQLWNPIPPLGYMQAPNRTATGLVVPSTFAPPASNVGNTTRTGTQNVPALQRQASLASNLQTAMGATGQQPTTGSAL